ncbi:UNVERIFIED_CONTAM: hypothetical protein FKN15_047713 [Acipenser sinensis]
MGVEGRVLDEVTATSRGYQLLVNSTAVEIRIPFGSVGGYRKSHVIENKYNQVYEIDLFLEHQWADDLWEVTQHRSFKPARSPNLPETPYVSLHCRGNLGARDWGVNRVRISSAAAPSPGVQNSVQLRFLRFTPLIPALTLSRVRRASR